MGVARDALWMVAVAILATCVPAAAAPEPAEPAETSQPDPWIAAGFSLGAPVGMLAISMATPFKELMFLVPATYGAGHMYARDPWRALSMSAGGYGAAVAGAGLAVGVVSLWPGTSAESLSRVIWGGALGAVGFGPFVAWDAMRTAKAAPASER